jgi:hypothetical protein
MIAVGGNVSQTTVEGFFDNTGGGVGAPSAKLSKIDDFVYGEVVDQALVDKKKFGSEEIERDKKTNEPIKQLVVILQTDQRGWANVAKVPTNEDGSAKDASEDDGRRAIYVAPFTNIHAAIGDAIIAATGAKGPILNGASLGVKIVDLKDTGKGNPLKIHQAKYVAPAPKPASDNGFFGDSNTAPAQPIDQAAAQVPPTTTAVAEQPAAPAAQPQVDPWTGQAASQGDGPPF